MFLSSASRVLFFSSEGHKVMLDRDLAALYGVTTFNLNKAVKRKIPTNDAGCSQHDAAEITGVCRLLNIVIAELKRGVEFGVEAENS